VNCIEKRGDKISVHCTVYCTPATVCVSIVIDDFYLKTGASEGADHMLTQLAALVLVINIFLLPPVLLIESMPNPVYLEMGL
jgi:hypothetical protein